MWEKLASILGGNVLEGVKDLVQTFKLPPEQQLQYDKAMAELQTNLQSGLAKIDADDRASARQREVQSGDSKRVWLLAIGITGGFFGVLGYMLSYPVPAGAERVIDVMLGSLGTAWIAVISYYFGSSSGSARKHDLIDKLVSR